MVRRERDTGTVLTAAGLARMQARTTSGAAILAGSRFPLLQLAEMIALTHHERWGGGGYPRGLAGEAIPLAGRITALADCFDALTHERPYKPAWPPAEALAEPRHQADGQFDPRVVAAVLSLKEVTRAED